MARIQRVKRNGVTYLSVVEDVYDSGTGKYKVKTIDSFGRASQESEIKAQMCLANYNQLNDIAKKELIEKRENKETIQKILKVGGYLALGALGIKALKYLFKKYDVEDE